MSKLSILTYHSIDSSGSVTSISPILFSQHLRFLKEHHFEVITLSKGLQLLRENKPLEKKVVLTFDDGYENFYSQAFPLLSQNRFPATVFLVSEYCGRDNGWSKKSNVSVQKLMNWTAIEKLSHAGIEFGSHSETHPDLTQVTLEEARKEISESRKTIEDRLQMEIRLFAYPYGCVDLAIRELVRKEYDAAVGTNLAQAATSEDPYNFSRIDVYYIAQHFELLASSFLTPYLAIRNVARLIRDKVTK